MKVDFLYRVNDWANHLSRAAAVRVVVKWAKRALYSRMESKLWNYFPDDRVINGPFEGMRFPHRSGNCSVFFPKLVGCYEAELHGIFDKLKVNHYEEIWDIGAADGYYAAGLALLFPDARVTAWERNPSAVNNCRITCERNEVAERVNIKGLCNRENLMNLECSCRALIVCDIEGGEGDLFDDDIVSRLRRTDFIVELHEAFRPGVTNDLLNIFKKTHTIILIDAISDEEKVSAYRYPPLHRMSEVLCRYATAERRYSKMQWLVALAG